MESVFERLHNQRTISNYNRCHSAGNNANERRDHLDFVLSSTYNHCKEVFPENPDYFYQRETKSKGKWGADGFIYFVERKEENLIIKYGGIKERKSPHSIKLMNFEHHSATSAPGYSRNPFGGPFSY